MKDFKNWGIKNRISKPHNYNAVWFNLKTIRFGEGQAKQLPPNKSEFYDVGINTKCNAECPFCYVSASHVGINYPNICNTWNKWMELYEDKVSTVNGVKYTVTEKPFQIAIGSTGEPTIHPDFCEFLETVYNSGVVPNYTTNGIILSNVRKNNNQSVLANNIIDYTRAFVGGVAVSFGNHLIRDAAEAAIENLIMFGETNINIHHIISTKESVDEFVEIWQRYGDDILYHVLLPLMPSGRSNEGIGEGVFEYLEEKIETLGIKNIAFGAHFTPYLKDSKIKTWLYEPESFSKNIILTENKVQITPSSFDLSPIKVLNV